MSAALLAAVMALAPTPAPRAGMDALSAVRLNEAYRLMGAVQDAVWPGWSVAPGDLVLVEGESEFSVRSPLHPRVESSPRPAPPPGFEPARAVPPLAEPVLARRRTFPPGFLATFPAFGPTPVIIVGTPEATGKSSTAWVLTLLHEHLHQLQYSDPTYFAETKALDLAGGDESGMWMLNYPFPYRASSEAFAALSRRLADLVEGAPAPEKRAAFWADYAAFGAGLASHDYRYLSLQLWQEGIARYVELRTAEAAARMHDVTPGFARLPDFEPYAAAAAALRAGIVKELRGQTMASEKRIVFYAFGASLGLLLDQEGVPWKGRYLKDKFYLERYR